VIAYHATLDVPKELVQFVAKLLLAERRRRGTPRGSVHDITAARLHDLPALYRAAADRPALADPAYEGAGIGVYIPIKQPPDGRDLDIDTRTRNAIQRSLRCLGLTITKVVGAQRPSPVFHDLGTWPAYIAGHVPRSWTGGRP